MADESLFRQINGDVNGLKEKIDQLTGSFNAMNQKVALIESAADKIGSVFKNLTSTLSGYALVQNDVLEIFTKYSRSIDDLSRSTSGYFTTADRLDKILTKTSKITNLSKQDVLSLAAAIDSHLVGSRNYQGLDSLINRIATLGKTAEQSREIMESLLNINSRFGTGISSGISQLTTKEISQLNRRDITNALQFQYATPETRRNKFSEITSASQQITSNYQNQMLSGGEGFTKTLLPIAQAFSNTLGQLDDSIVKTIAVVGGIGSLGWLSKKGKGIFDNLLGKENKKGTKNKNENIENLINYRGGTVPVRVENIDELTRLITGGKIKNKSDEPNEPRTQQETLFDLKNTEKENRNKKIAEEKEKIKQKPTTFRSGLQKGWYDEQDQRKGGLRRFFSGDGNDIPNLTGKIQGWSQKARGVSGEILGKFGSKALSAGRLIPGAIGGSLMIDQYLTGGKFTNAIGSSISGAIENLAVRATGEQNRGAVKGNLNVLGSMTSNAVAYGSAGAMLGPYGAAIGAVGGGIYGLYKGLSENKAKTEAEQNKLIDNRQDKLDKLNKDVENSLKSNKNDYNTIKKLVNEYNSGLKSGEEHLSAQQIVLQQLTDSMQQTLITAERIKEVSSERASIFQGLQEYYTTESINPAKAVAVSKEMVIARNKEIQADTIANNKRLELYSQMKQMGIGSYKEIENEITTYQKLVTETDAKIKTSTESDKTKLEQLKESYKSQLKLAEQNKKTVQEGAKNFNINPDTLVDTEASTLTAKNAKNQLEALKNIFQYEMANIAPLQERQQITTNIAQLQERLSETARLGMGAEYGAIVNTASNLQKELNISLQSLKQMGDSANYWQKQIQSGQYNTQEIAAINDHINKLTIESYRQQGKALEDQQKIFEKMSTLREKYVSALPEMSIGVNFELDPTQAMGLTSLMGPGSGSFLVGGNRGGGLGYTAGGSTWGGSAFSGQAPWNAYRQMPWGPGPAVASPSGLQGIGAGFYGNKAIPQFKRGGFIPGNENEPRLIQAHGDEYVLSSDNVDKFNKIIGEDSGGGGKDYINEYINKEYNRKRIKGFKTGGSSTYEKDFDYFTVYDGPVGKQKESITEQLDKIVSGVGPYKELNNLNSIKDLSEQNILGKYLSIMDSVTGNKKQQPKQQRRRPGKVNSPLWGIDIARANAIQQQKNQNLMGQRSWFLGMRGGSNIRNSVGQSYGDSGYRKIIPAFKTGGLFNGNKQNLTLKQAQELLESLYPDKDLSSLSKININQLNDLIFKSIPIEKINDFINLSEKKQETNFTPNIIPGNKILKELVSLGNPQILSKEQKDFIEEVKKDQRIEGGWQNIKPDIKISTILNDTRTKTHRQIEQARIIKERDANALFAENLHERAQKQYDEKKERNRFKNAKYHLNAFNASQNLTKLNEYVETIPQTIEQEKTTPWKKPKDKTQINNIVKNLRGSIKGPQGVTGGDIGLAYNAVYEAEKKLTNKEYSANKKRKNNALWEQIQLEKGVEPRNLRPYSFKTGGKSKGTPITDDGGFLAVLHPKEVVLNERQIGNLNKQIGLTNQDFAKAGVPGFKNGGPTLSNNITTSNTSRSSGHNHGSSIKSKILCHKCQSDLMGEISVETINSSLGLQDTGPSSIQSSYVL